MRISHGIRIGIYAAITLIVLSWINFYSTRSMGTIVPQVGSVAAIVLSSFWMVPAIKHARDSRYNGSISFWAAFFSAMQVGVIQAVGMFFSTLVFMAVSTSAYRDWSTPEDFDTSQALVMAPGEQAVIMTLIVLFISTVMALTISMSVQRKNDVKATSSDPRS